MNHPQPPPKNFFVAGGTLWREAPSYIVRPADRELLELTLAGEYCNVLSARQMGKSSLMVRTANRLHEQGVQTAIIDMSVLGSGIATPDEWFFGFLDELAHQFGLQTDLDAWWQAHSAHNPVQRFSNFLRDVVLNETANSVVIFIDEIDSALGLDFTDDFFAAIRAAYNARANTAAFARLTFVLIGVARPADLIEDQTRTPYNIGTHVALSDFRFEELTRFQSVLEDTYLGDGEQILRWALAWTRGQPYLTQKLCAALAAHPAERLTAGKVQQTVTQLFLGDEARQESNLRAIRDRIHNSPNKTELVQIYQKILRGKKAPDEARSHAKNELKLTGLVRVDVEGMLKIRNRIYQQVFDRNWIKQQLPPSRARQLAVLMSILAVLALAVAGYALYRQRAQTAQTFREQFETSASPDVRLTSLARLIELDSGSAELARELFAALPGEEKLALFTALSSPQNVAAELVTVIEFVYQDLENTPPDNGLLGTMAEALGQIGAAGAPSLKTEIGFWLKGREEAGQNENYTTALSFFNSAWTESEARGHPNPGIRFDEGLAHAAVGEHEAALAAFEAALTLAPGKLPAVAHMLNEQDALRLFWAQNADAYPVLSAAVGNQVSQQIPTATSPPTTAHPTSTRAPTPTPTITPAPEIIYPYDLAFVSDRDGMFSAHLMATHNTEQWLALPRPSEYERVWWPTFCGALVAAETQDLDGLQPQWVHVYDPEDPAPVPWVTAHTSARLGVPRCSPDGRYLAYSAYLPPAYAEWVLLVHDLYEDVETIIDISPALGYVSWPQQAGDFLAMSYEGGEFVIQQIAGFPPNTVPEPLIAGKYPAISPDGTQMVYLCAHQRYLCLQDLDSPTPRLLHAVQQIRVEDENIPLTAMWSADGLWVYFASAEDGDWDIYRIHPDGSNLQNMTADWPSNEIMPALRWIED